MKSRIKKVRGFNRINRTIYRDVSSRYNCTRSMVSLLEFYNSFKFYSSMYDLYSLLPDKKELLDKCSHRLDDELSEVSDLLNKYVNHSIISVVNSMMDGRCNKLFSDSYYDHSIVLLDEDEYEIISSISDRVKEYITTLYVLVTECDNILSNGSYKDIRNSEKVIKLLEILSEI